MATSFTPHPFLSYPLASRSHQFSLCSQTQPPAPQPPVPPSQSTPQPLFPSLNATSSQQPTPQVLEINIRPGKYAGSSNVETTDWVASSLTRRFGLAAGVTWAGFLAGGVLSEQIKTRLEVSQQKANTRDLEKEEEVVLPNGIRYYEIRVGGGACPRIGDLVVIDLKGSIKDNGEEFVNSFGGDKKPLALVMGSRPYTRGICEGIEYVLKTMNAGAKRRVIVPPTLGFGENGADFGSAIQIPPSATLEYIVEVEKVSIAPA